MQHFLKANPQHFETLCTGEQKCSIRKNDRNFQVGDEVIFLEYDTVSERCTGDSHLLHISHIENFGVRQGYVALSLSLRTLS